MRIEVDRILGEYSGEKQVKGRDSEDIVVAAIHQLAGNDAESGSHHFPMHGVGREKQ